MCPNVSTGEGCAHVGRALVQEGRYSSSRSFGLRDRLSKKTYTYIILKQKRRFYTNKINNTCRISLVFLHLRHVNLHHLQETSSTHVYSKTVLLQPFRLATRPNCGNTQLLYHPLDQLVGSNTISRTHSRSVIINVSGRIDLFRLISYMRHVNQFSQDIYCVDE